MAIEKRWLEAVKILAPLTKDLTEHKNILYTNEIREIIATYTKRRGKFQPRTQAQPQPIQFQLIQTAQTQQTKTQTAQTQQTKTQTQQTQSQPQSTQTQPNQPFKKGKKKKSKKKNSPTMIFLSNLGIKI